MWGRAQLLLALLTALSAFGDDVHDDSQLRVGRSVDIFTRYGYLSLSMKVVPRNDSDFLFREPTIDIFDDLDRFVVRAPKTPKKRIFDGDFHMEFCDSVKQLLQAYFRDFAIERMERPWRAFTASWSPESIARNLGINSSFVQKDNCYVLLRLARFRDSVKLAKIPNNINLVDVVARQIDKIQLGDVSSVVRFIRKYGSHYIDSYVTGNALYQVFVFKRNTYQTIKTRLKTLGISHFDRLELSQYFGPWFAEHIGRIKVASGNRTVQSWALTKLRVNNPIFSFHSLLKIHGDSKLLGSLNQLLQNEAVLELGLKSLAPAFKNPDKRAFFLEVLDNFSKLWESNL